MNNLGKLLVEHDLDLNGVVRPDSGASSCSHENELKVDCILDIFTDQWYLDVLLSLFIAKHHRAALSWMWVRGKMGKLNIYNLYRMLE